MRYNFKVTDIPPLAEVIALAIEMGFEVPKTQHLPPDEQYELVRGSVRYGFYSFERMRIFLIGWMESKRFHENQSLWEKAKAVLPKHGTTR